MSAEAEPTIITSPVDIWGVPDVVATPQTEAAQEATEDKETPPVTEKAPKAAPAKGKAETPAVQETEEEPAGDEGEEDPDEFRQFFGSVEEITGEQIEGNFDNTAQGIAGYITAAKHKAVNDTFARIQENDPRAYAYLVHRANNGTDADFFAATGNANLPTIEQVRANPAIQEQVLRGFYQAKGIGDREIGLLVGAAKDDEKLASSAETILSQQIQEEATKSAAFLAKDAQEKAELQRAITQTANHITSVVQKGDLNGWTLPKQEQSAFMDYLDSRFDYIDGRPYIKVELTDENLGQELQSQYLSYRKGNLNDLVKRKADTQNVQKLRIKQAEAAKPKRGGNSEGQQGNTLKSVW